MQISQLREGAPVIAAVGTAFPKHYYEQQELLSVVSKLWQLPQAAQNKLDQLHANVGVHGRHLVRPLDAYVSMDTFGKRNDVFVEEAPELATQALRTALEQASLDAQQIDHIFFVSVTGIATPSIDARLVNRMKLRTDIRRTPIFGLGCVAGVAGVARVNDYLLGHPRHTAALVSVELCSLALSREKVGVPAMIAGALFADGAAATILRGSEVAEGAVPQVVATKAVFYPDTEGVMGWDISERGFDIILSADVPKVVASFLKRDVTAFLEEHGLTKADVKHFVCHPGGPKVIAAIEQALELPEAALVHTREALAEMGNLSSASVLVVLERTLRDNPQPGFGLMLAMGPGFCSELVLLKW